MPAPARRDETMTSVPNPSADTGSLLDEGAAARAAAAVALRLAAAGAQPGDRVAVVAGNGPAFVAARDAATAAALVLAPINPRLAGPEVAWIGGHARPRAVLTERAHLDLASAAAGDAPVIVVDDLAPAPGLDLAAVHAAVGATLLYTSGTTGRPKGCLRTAAQEAARVAELTATYRLAADDVHLIACPLAHSAPGIFLRACRAAGARTVILHRFDPALFLAAVARWRATIVFLVPTQWQRLLALPAEVRAAADLSSLRAAIVAGAPIAPATKAAAEAWLGTGRLYEFYGSSETGTVTVIGPGEHASHPGSVGRPPTGVSVRVLDENGAPVGDGAVGEIHVASPAVMAGYLEADGRVARAGERDGHVSVGDLGRLDDGWLTLVDRKHDTIISGGVNVYPAEVERALADHPAIAGAVVFGVDDADWGQVVAAVVAARPGQALAPADVRAFLRDRVAGYKLPRAIALCELDELPIGSSGKALRRAARAAFAARLVPVA
jgi:long-chain acyl-CoA synthetase